MTQEEKQLLLKDLAARVPYGVRIMFSHNGFRWDWEQTLDEITKCDDGEYAVNGWGIHGIKPYLRSMSSMTEEETLEFVKTTINTPDGYPMWTTDSYDWLNEHHFDYRGLIPMGLALEAPEGMYTLQGEKKDNFDNELKNDFPLDILSEDEIEECRELAKSGYVGVVEYLKKVHPEMGLKECKIYYDLYFSHETKR